VDSAPPVPPGHARPMAARLHAFTVAHVDRVRVLLTELKRLTAAGAPVALRCGREPRSQGDVWARRCGGCDVRAARHRVLGHGDSRDQKMHRKCTRPYRKTR
jgi:hypothetical protein